MTVIRSQKGITMLELLIVLALIAIIGGIAVWSSSGIIESFKVRGAVRQLFGDMQMARLRAIKEGKEFGVEFVSSTAYCVKRRVGTNWDDGCDIGGEDTVDEILKTVDLTTDYSGVSANPICGGSTGRVDFNYDGTAGCSGNKVTLSDSNGTRTQSLCINTSTGNIRIVNSSTCS